MMVCKTTVPTFDDFWHTAQERVLRHVLKSTSCILIAAKAFEIALHLKSTEKHECTFPFCCMNEVMNSITLVILYMGPEVVVIAFSLTQEYDND